MRRAVPCLVALLLATPVAAQEPQAVEPTEVHVVQRGETLWELARRYLGDPHRWREIYRLNVGAVEDPHWIYPAERLRIPGATVREGAAAVAERGAAPAAPAARGPAPEVRRVGERVVPSVFAEGGLRRTAAPRLAAERQALLPAYREGDFRRAGLLVPEEAIAPVGVLIEPVNPSVVAPDVPALVEPFDPVYLRLSSAGVEPGERLQMFRPGRRIKPYGRIYEPTGIVEVRAIDGEIATAVVREMYGVVSEGDLALPLARPDIPRGVRLVPVVGPEGVVLAFALQQPVPSTGDIAFVDLGSESGVTEGDELLAYLPVRVTEEGALPMVEVARMQVVRVTERTAAARVTELRYSALEPGMPVRLVARMP